MADTLMKKPEAALAAYDWSNMAKNIGETAKGRVTVVINGKRKREREPQLTN
jgi:hypothetical protein